MGFTICKYSIASHARVLRNGRDTGFLLRTDPTEPLSTEVVEAIAQAHDEDIIEQKWIISEDINTDSLDELSQDNNLGMTLRFEADTTTVTITADVNGTPESKLSHTGRYATLFVYALQRNSTFLEFQPRLGLLTNSVEQSDIRPLRREISLL
ncbi:HalOD1 output domain-containing protein [Halobaculum saliterrae]|uniref:HalOD1 output domain-containing protein n=1 Tax=Halobaculum saliterrae TaxID=2073113 RepID=UPI001F22F605|nr:HalOD1 output domain-containing protein [Halobaculum saliterrae]